MRDRMFDSERDHRGMFLPLAVLIFAGVLGNLVGRGLALIVPGGIIHDILVSGFRFGIDPPWRLNLWVLSLSFGFTLNLTFLGALCMIFFLFLYKRA